MRQGLVELLVVIGVIAILLGLLFGVLSVARQRAVQTSCARNLSNLAAAVQLYANENRGWVPRDYGMDIVTREPGWQTQLGRLLRNGAEVDREKLWQYDFFRCAAHPEERAATSYVLNAFAFETAPNWRPAGPTRLAIVQRPSQLPWIADCADRFAPPDPDGLQIDTVFFGQYHDLWAPVHLETRLAKERHGTRLNMLYLDGHVASILRSELRLEDFDDGIRQRVDRANW